MAAACLTLLSVSPAHAQWIQEPGTGWVQLIVYHQDTREEFGPNGDVKPFFADGHAVMTSLFVTAAGGVVPGVDVWVQFPLHRLVFSDLAARREKFGPGDPKVFVRVGPELFGGQIGIPIAVRAGVKLSVGEFPIDSEIIPLTEGQRDYEVMLELGHSFWPRPAWAQGWVGYRWREFNERIDRKPGNELFAYATVGGQLGRLTLKLSGEALVGRTPRLVNVPVGNARREIYQLFPTVGWRIGPGDVELGGRFPVAGQNLPARPALTVGYFFNWRLRPGSG